MDGSGNLYLTGYFRDETSLGGNALVSSGDDDIFLASFDARGGHRWSKRFGSTGQDYGAPFAADQQGRVYLAGQFTGSVKFGAQTLTTPGWAYYLASFDSSGNALWAIPLGANNVYVTGIALDTTGQIAVVGHILDGAVDFGSGVLSYHGKWDVLVAKFSSQAGRHVWSKSFGAAEYDEATAVAIDANEDLYVAGGSQGILDLGSGPLPWKGAGDAFVAKFSSAGALQWAKGYGGAELDWSWAIATKPAGELYLAGSYEGDFGGTAPLTSAGEKTSS